jgi:ATP-dependent Clp protease, protease subunit
MPLGVPRVPFQLFGEDEAYWVDLYNRLYRDRILFLGADLDDELSNQIVGLIQFLNRETLNWI